MVQRKKKKPVEVDHLKWGGGELLSHGKGSRIYGVSTVPGYEFAWRIRGELSIY